MCREDNTYLPCGGDPAGLCCVGDTILMADGEGETRPPTNERRERKVKIGGENERRHVTYRLYGPS